MMAGIIASSHPDALPISGVNIFREPGVVQSFSGINPFNSFVSSRVNDGILQAGDPLSTFCWRTLDQTAGTNNGSGVLVTLNSPIALAEIRICNNGLTTNMNHDFTVEYNDGVSWILIGRSANDCPGPNQFYTIKFNSGRVAALQWRVRIAGWVVPVPAANFYCYEIEGYAWL